MDEVKGELVEIRYNQFVVFFDDGSTQTFIVEDGAGFEAMPPGTDGTPAFIRITHTTGDYEDVYMHHVHFTRFQTVSRKKRTSVKVDDTKTTQTTAPRST